jgi:hypothetical protein
MTTTTNRTYAGLSDLMPTIRDHFAYTAASMPAPVDVTVTAASRIGREWGEYGYTVRCIGPIAGGYGFIGRARDGGEFVILVDHYCNTLPIPDEWMA